MTETFDAFTRRVSGFEDLSPTDKICHAAWYLHAIVGAEYVTTASINALFSGIHAVQPPTAVYLPRMAERKPPLMIRSRKGYRLENRRRREIEQKYPKISEQIVVSSLLTGLVSKMNDSEEGKFLAETLRCYSVSAFRASIVMAWNLAYDHVMRWILADAERLHALNDSLSVKYPKKYNEVNNLDNFSEFKEYEIVESMAHAKIINKNVADILREKLKRRNAAAHPSGIVIVQSQADDVITDLVNNIILKLA